MASKLIIGIVIGLVVGLVLGIAISPFIKLPIKTGNGNKTITMEIELNYYNVFNTTAISFTCSLFNPTNNTLYNCMVDVSYVNAGNQNAATTVTVGNVSAQPNFNSPHQVSFVINNFYMTAEHLDESDYIKLSAYGNTKP